MPNSGAFRSLHCLIYKVLAPRRSVAEHSLLYHNSNRLSSTFFKFFQLFSYRTFQFSSYSVAQLSYHKSFRLSSTFFDFFQNLFSYPAPEELLARKLNYLTTASSLCQALFSNFFEKLFQAFPSTDLSATARLIYQIIPPLSTPFLVFFEKISFFAPSALFSPNLPKQHRTNCLIFSSIWDLQRGKTRYTFI